MANSTVYVVHCIDTEGPLHESLQATFERIRHIVGIEIEPTAANLKKLQNREIDLNGQEELVSQIVAPHVIEYKDTWDKIDAMMEEIMSPAYRQKYADPSGQGWIYNWFAVDHVGFDVNPRRRDMGYHNIFDHYRHLLQATGSTQDEIHWHFHPMSTYKEAHICATSFLNSPHLLETLARRVIERSWFPTCFRPGFHAERPDSHWFLEQWIPFDFANQSMSRDRSESRQKDVDDGRLGDWRRAVWDWSHYRPAHDDYQREGSCNRTIFKCLNVGSRFRLLNQSEVDLAFRRADEGLPTVLAFTNHDYRDMRPDIANVHAMLTEAAKKYPNVRWEHSGALKAARQTLGLRDAQPLDLDVRFEREDGVLRLRVRSNKDTFGPQPFLAVQTKDQRFLHDNFDLQTPRREWSYVFDRNSVRPESIERIGIAGSDAYGNVCVALFDGAGSPVGKTSF
ncbi:hypothetical protein J19TS2_01330 [Cohnella xylanilytica]|uniref:hypothetical protein n=1 Tax=Cohnella xylanilytica TaxID=557555 RepID=UPI001B2B3648|nr:hypothetical protein [Cohnella xylanilytica]GIO10578.1 hypothetical protein J19TS2_01330 [Cohnella xylanilytica]